MVVLGVAHHKVEDPLTAGNCSQTFCKGKLFCLESPEMKKLSVCTESQLDSLTLTTPRWGRKHKYKSVFHTFDNILGYEMQ